MDRNTNRFVVSLLRVGSANHLRRRASVSKFGASPQKSGEQMSTNSADVHGNPRHLTESCAEMRPHFEPYSAALHLPELNWHLTKSRLNDAPPLCEMQRPESCLARH